MVWGTAVSPATQGCRLRLCPGPWFSASNYLAKSHCTWEREHSPLSVSALGWGCCTSASASSMAVGQEHPPY